MFAKCNEKRALLKNNKVIKIEKEGLEGIREIGSRLARHDLLNALTQIEGNADFMLMTNSFNREGTEDIKKYSIKMEGLVKMTAGYLNLGEEKKDIAVSRAFYEAALLYPELSEKIEFTSNCQLRVKAHEFVLTHIFYNLIHNSEKYAGEKLSEIRLECKKNEITYKDNGGGISKNEKEKIFEKGYTEGTSAGLGLFLIQQFCKIYEWQIREQGVPGQGVEFVVTVPI